MLEKFNLRRRLKAAIHTVSRPQELITQQRFPNRLSIKTERSLIKLVPCPCQRAIGCTVQCNLPLEILSDWCAGLPCSTPPTTTPSSAVSEMLMPWPDEVPVKLTVSKSDIVLWTTTTSTDSYLSVCALLFGDTTKSRTLFLISHCDERKIGLFRTNKPNIVICFQILIWFKNTD